MSLNDYPKTARLKNGQEVILRPLAQGDFARLFSFFQTLPPEDRLFLADDVSNADLIHRWTQELDFSRVFPLVAVDENRIVADGTLHMVPQGWMRHVGQIRMVTAPTHRRIGLAAVMVRELVALAGELKLERIQAHVIADSADAVRMFEAVGFKQAAVVKNLVKDQHGHERDLAIMINDVASLTQILEDWIQDSMIGPSRGSGEGIG
jgi:RimJ/RimL family protein N-acetyltransferase